MCRHGLCLEREHLTIQKRSCMSPTSNSIPHVRSNKMVLLITTFTASNFTSTRRQQFAFHNQRDNVKRRQIRMRRHNVKKSVVGKCLCSKQRFTSCSVESGGEVCHRQCRNEGDPAVQVGRSDGFSK